jgi:hypothetical protein
MVTEFGIPPTDGSSTREKIRHPFDDIYKVYMIVTSHLPVSVVTIEFYPYRAEIGVGS